MEDSIIIQKAVIPDAHDLTVISKAAKSHWGYSDDWIKLWEEELTITPDYISHHQVWKLCEGDQIIGFASVENHREYYEIGHLWVLPDHIGKGYGSNLLLYCNTHSIPPGSKVRVISDPYAKGFYERHGFIEIGSHASKPEGRMLPVLERSRGR